MISQWGGLKGPKQFFYFESVLICYVTLVEGEYALVIFFLCFVRYSLSVIFILFLSKAPEFLETSEPNQDVFIDEATHPSHSVTTPVVKLEPPDTSESMASHACRPSLEWERLLHEEQSHSGQSSTSKEALEVPSERGSSERQSSIASATYGIREELLTIADLDQRTLQASKSQGQSQRGSRKPDENPDASAPSERHDTSVTSTSTIPSPRPTAVCTI